MKQLNKGNTIHIKTLKLSHKTLTETKKNKFSQKKKLFSSLHPPPPPPPPPATNPSSIRQATNYKMPAASHSSQPLKAYKPKINSKISSESWLPTCFLPQISSGQLQQTFLSSSLSEQCHQCNVTNIKTLQHKTLSLSLSLSLFRNPKKQKSHKTKSCKTNLEICSILSQKKSFKDPGHHQKN
jgi:hypothetical protein